MQHPVQNFLSFMRGHFVIGRVSVALAACGAEQAVPYARSVPLFDCV